MIPPVPPPWIDSLLRKLAPAALAEEILGDMYELFLHDIREKNPAVAKRTYIINGLGFLVKRFFWKHSSDYSSNPFIMFNNYFRMAWRSLMAYKGNTVINLAGLVIGIASALVIFTVIRFERSFDSFHSNAARIYRIVRVSGENRDEYRTGISYPVPAALQEEVPTIASSTSMEYFGASDIDVPDEDGKGTKAFLEESGVGLTDDSFFQVFDFKNTDFKWISGNPQNALVEPYSVVLTKSIAQKYFGDAPALGKVLRFNKEIDCKITGVIEDLPDNTDFPFTILISYSTVHKKEDARMNDWNSVSDNHQTYVVLKPGTSQSEMEEEIAAMHARHTPKSLHETRHYLLQPLHEIHTDARFGTYKGRTISNETILALSLIAVFLLLTAVINYINLSTAQSTMRAKEIGLRKVMGSNQRHLIAQFLTETFVTVISAGFLALFVAEGILFRFQSLLNMKWTHYHFTEPFVLLSLAVIVICVTLFAGLYPSILISRFNPIAALKNKFSTERIGGFSLRKVLVVFQFTITQILVVGTFIVVSQMNYFNERDMGFSKEAIVTLTLPKADKLKQEALAGQLRTESYVADVSYSFTLPSGVHRYNNYRGIARQDATSDKDYLVFEYFSVDTSYLNLYQIKLLAGRNLTEQDTSDHILINKSLATRLQLGTPEEALGAQLKMGNTATVVGVIDDFYSNSLKESVTSIVMMHDPSSFYALSIKLNSSTPASLKEAIAGIEKIWKVTYPDYPISYRFFDDNIREFYVQEEKYALLFQVFSFVFLSIGCLGLYGLITFVVNRKAKEVAIRKVLGASIAQILTMFSKEYVQLILLSFVLAIPVAYYAVNSWLSNFAEKVPLQWWLFFLPGLFVLAVALLVVISKSMTTANANPVDKLKHE